eukprot:TRINITY_DN3956_c1_g1_i1.p1 TRINITY_DN3956_c1_g1~~TRINITY_DN3956_c1_g1_i1.p1  ORF type:complete len:528 (+),score=120.45 TRINITY_DN3956_c1_g1_i1:101-1585(+)
MPAAEATGSPRSTGTPCTPSAAASSSSGGGQCCKEENCEQPRTGMSEYCLGHRKGLTRSECLERRPGSVVWTTSVMAQRCGRLGCEGDRAGPSGFCSAHRPDREEASSSSTSAQIRLGNYHVGSIIGSGAFCEVRIGHHVVTKQKYAVKVMSLQAVKEMRCEDLICMEIQLLLDLQHPNIIRAHEAMRTEDCIVIVMDFMSGGELFDMITQHGRLTAAQSRGYYQDLLRGVCALHAASIAHRDLKPENFVLGLGRQTHHIYMLDYGLAKRYCDPKTGQHIPHTAGKSLVGTTRYASVNTHLGIEQSRRDDLEGLGMVLIYLTLSRLPWQGTQAANRAEKERKIMEKKIITKPAVLCAGLPKCFESYMTYVRSLKFPQEPDYAYCRRLFSQEYEKIHGHPYDWIFDWDVMFKERRTRGLVARNIVSHTGDFTNDNMVERAERPDTSGTIMTGSAGLGETGTASMAQTSVAASIPLGMRGSGSKAELPSLHSSNRK